MAVPVSMPPFFIFARKNYRDYLNARVPDGSAGFANKSGSITADNFASYMEHFIKHTRLTEDKPMFILLDNYQSYLNIKILDLAKENRVVTYFPPHTSLKSNLLFFFQMPPHVLVDFMVLPPGHGRSVTDF